MTTTKNKILTAAVTIAILLSIFVLVYVNLPKQHQDIKKLPPESGPSILTISLNDEQTTYTLEELEALQLYTGIGGYRTSFPSIRGVGNYTGVPIQTLISSLDATLDNYTIIVISNDGTTIENKTFNHSVISGSVDLYNPENASDSTPIGQGGVTMVLTYKYEGNYLNGSKEGNLKTAFLNDNGAITTAGLWWKYIVEIQVIPE